MTIKIAPGSSKILTTKVSNSDSARTYGSGLLDVYATPAMIALMERTSMELVQEYLPAGYGTVGTKIDVDHLKASSVGASIECKSTLIETDTRKLRFKVVVTENGVPVGSGIHERFIIEEDKFLKKLRQL